MSVPSFEFLGCALVVAALLHLSQAPLWRRSILIVANIAFLLSFSHDPIVLAPFVGLLALGFVSLKIMEAKPTRAGFVPLVVAIVLVFCWLKRYAFVPEPLLLHYAYLGVGISYVFFRILHLVIDAFQGTLPEKVGIGAYVSYTLSFTSLVSGPIQFYGEYRQTETIEPAPLDAGVATHALGRIVTGFFKVSVLSPMLSALHERSIAWFAVAHGPGELCLAALCEIGIFPIFLYVNFSGYMDFVVGVSRFMRLAIPENFNKPFMAVSFIDFWSRWHMTLSNWLKTYVYSPLLLALIRRYPDPAVGPMLGVFVYFVTFFLVGLWHGSTWMFVVYGVLQGLGVSVNKLYQLAMTKRLGKKGYKALCAVAWYRSLSRGLTFSFFAVSLLWFWSSWPHLQLLAAGLGLLCVPVLLAFVAVASVLLSGCKAVGDRYRMPSEPALFSMRRSAARVAWFAAIAVATITVSVVMDAPAPTIVYKAF